MPSTPRGRNAATAAAVAMAILLAFVWLRSSDADTPSVPVGLPVATVPAAVEAPVRPAGLGPASKRKPAGERRPAGERPRRHEHADRTGGVAEDDSRDPARENRLAPRQNPPAMAPAPKAGSGTADAGPPAVSGGGPSPAQPAPEFAIG